MQRIVLDLPRGPLHVHVAGTGPPVLLLHGAMLDSAQFTWLHAGPALAERFRVYAVDLPRHGGSRPWQGEIGAGELDSVLVQTLDGLGLTSTSLVGFSMGASVALQFALAHPERTDAAVFVAPGGLGPRGRGQLGTWLVASVGFLQQVALRRLARDPGLALRRLLHAGRQTPSYTELVQLQRQEALSKLRLGEPLFDDRQRLAYGPLRMRLDLLGQVADLDVPSLWLCGSADRVVRTAMIAEAAARCSARFDRIPHAGHLVPLDQPDAFARVVRDFLSAPSR